MRHQFGWDLPPGVTMRDIDPPEQPCDVCGLFSDHCICPECQKCGTCGDPKCYAEHGLKRTKDQLLGKARLDLGELEERVGEQAQYIAWLEAQPDDFTE